MTKEKKMVQNYPPVVVVLGHVDHGKTTLLDAIRKTNMADKEHGGITQSIGASNIEIIHEGEKRRITFIDTPGHETFPKMRSRGVIVADIALLVVSSVDGVKPQTKESIKLIQDSKIPFIVVLTKADLEGKNPEKAKQQLLKEGITLERMGGDVPVIEISAKTNLNIKELLELIILTLDLSEDYQKQIKERSETGQFKGVVIESKLDSKVGAKASFVVKNGTISVKDDVYCEGIEGRVKTLISDTGKYINTATIGDAVEILGFQKVPPVGGVIYKKTEMTLETADLRPQKIEIQKPMALVAELSILNKLEKAELSMILCTDTEGTLEAIKNALPKEVNLISAKTGEVTPADVLLAKSVNGVIIGFNLKVKNDVTRLALLERVLFKNYTIIYELIDEIKDVLEGKKLELEEKIFGKSKILASFPFEKTKVMGIKVLEGRVAKGDKVRLLHDDKEIGESTIHSIRQGKDSISKVEKNGECGVILTPFLDFTIGDMLVSHS